jgi:ABC-type transport system involved in multi-copper enzyme maturation permease subunit
MDLLHMGSLLRVFAILLADLRERMRTPRFWVVLGVMTIATWWCFPPADAGYSTLSLVDGARGRYSSGWMGMGLGLIYSSLLLNLVGFYLVRGTLTRDFDTRVWQLLVATPMTRGGYLLAKWASHMAVFAAIMLTGLVVAVVAQWVRAEDRHIDLIELVKPLLLLSVPSLALTAMFAIWFDLVPWLRRTAGNVLFFVVWTTMLSLSVAGQDGKSTHDPQGWTSDPSGMIVAAHEFARVREAQTGKPQSFGFNLGGDAVTPDSEFFDWPAWHPDARLVASRALWLLLAMLGTLAAAPLLDWAASRGLGKAKARSSGGGRALRWLHGLFDLVLDPFARGPLGILTVAELKLALRQRAWWWWLAALGVMGAQFGAEEGLRVGLLLAWMLPLDVLARGVLRERDHGTGALVFTAPNALARLLAARFLVGFAMLFALSLPALLRMLASEPLSALAAVTAMVSIASWGLSLGALCRNSRPFELLMVCVAYVCLQGAALLAVTTQPVWTLTVHAIGLLPAWLLLAWAWPRLARR